MTGHVSLKPMSSILNFSKWATGRVPPSTWEVWDLCLHNVHSAPTQLSPSSLPLACLHLASEFNFSSAVTLFPLPIHFWPCLGFQTSFNPLFSLFMSLPCLWTTDIPEYKLGRKRLIMPTKSFMKEYKSNYPQTWVARGDILRDLPLWQHSSK